MLSVYFGIALVIDQSIKKSFWLWGVLQSVVVEAFDFVREYDLYLARRFNVNYFRIV